MIPSLPKQPIAAFIPHTQIATRSLLTVGPAKLFPQTINLPISAAVGARLSLRLRSPCSSALYHPKFIVKPQRSYLHKSTMASSKSDVESNNANTLFQAIETRFPPDAAGKEAWFLVTVR
jgi:hypothetical protein